MKLLIVESPSKAKTIEKYLGSDWRVIASIGHVRDLIPENGSVDVENDFAMKWQIMDGKEKQIKLIIDAIKKSDEVYLASDPDREGEAIAWHILDIINEKNILKGKPVYRITFNEITKKAVNESIAHPREIDSNLVDAYLVRRALDFLIGFGISPLLWRKNLGKSAGRVQSVAVKLVVDREREIEKFVAQEYWSLIANCAKNKDSFDAKLSGFNGEKIEKMTIGNRDAMDKILSNINVPLTAQISELTRKKISRKPAAPFITSTLQQEAARKLHFSSKRTMMAAQRLYEQGLITYMRTDSTNLSKDAVSDIRDYIKNEFGANFLPANANVYATKSKNAQEAHEAVRPTHFNNDKHNLSGDEAKLYDLIWKRTIACQMNNAEFDNMSVDITDKKSSAVFHATGSVRTFDGFMKVYVEDKDDTENELISKLPLLVLGDEIQINELTPNQHFTQPPARFTEASLVKKLEELGIGRPSTYSAIMSTIVDRKYVEQDKQRRFIPTPGGWVLSAYLSKHFDGLVDVNFTAKTEDTLDDVADGKTSKIPALKEFWTPTSTLINDAKNIKTSDVIDEINLVMKNHLFPDGNNTCPKCGGTLGIKLSKFGPFIGCDKYPDCDFTKRLYADDESNPSNHPEKMDIDLGDNILFKIGRFGPYVTDGSKNVSAKQYNSDSITLEIAKELLAAEPKKAQNIDLGINPKTGNNILFYPTGRYGAYISSNKVNVSVKEQPTLDEAIELINNKKPAAKFKKKK